MNKAIFLAGATLVAGCVLIPLMGWDEGLPSTLSVTASLAIFILFKK